ncbi:MULTISPECIES: HAAS signaling domain-containing protein [unclassified Paenibacillus]|uniref:HAAS signaling domain-containing protein n=1 Tax=unclassified Paenibacillus TaxID=185978 RepID=UPI00070A37D5|nr:MULTISPECIES: DUF1700 domain-containing protein [unclassified Paenibacillus]KQX63811.1 hypothetical protein ASD40_29165 [Paenibacillus sp. Root444D2]KRE45191.1 hypothetical protein ASG85_31680 [Paenibacillus sp. Soil724D2]
MSKIDYFKELNYRLRGLPEKERQNILSVYEELFQKAIENGKQEDDVAQSLGYPRVPNWDAQKETPSTEQEPSKSTSGERAEKSYPRPEPTAAPKQAPETKGFPPYTPPQGTNPYVNPNPYPYPVKQESSIKAIIVSIMLGFFNLLFVVGPWFGVLAALIALFAAGFALIISPIVGILGSYMGTVGSDMRFIGFAMLACFGLGIILTTLSSWLFKQFFKLSWLYIRFNAKLIKGA